MENSVRYKRLEEAVASVYIDRLFAHDEIDSLGKMHRAAVELNLNYEGGNIIDSKGQVQAQDVRKLLNFAGRLHAGEDTLALQDELRVFMRPFLDDGLHF
jgi:hypothetical protein